MTHQVMSLIPVERPGLGTMAVDDYGRLDDDPAFLEERDVGHRAFVVLHECIHVWGRHAKRAICLLGERPAQNKLEIWRKAVDVSVNDILEQSGLKCPDEGITPAKLNLPRNHTPEQYYNMLLDKAEQERKAAEEQRKAEQEAEQDKQGNQPGEAEDGDDQDDAEQGQQEGQEGEQEQDGQGDSQDAAESDADGQGEQQGQEGKSKGQGEAEGEGQGQGEQPASLAPGEPYDGPQPDRSQGDGGSSCDGQPRAWECGPPSDECPGMAEHEQNLLQAAVAKTIEEYEKQHGRGSVPGGLAREASNLLHPKVDPARELLAKVKYAVACTSGFGNFTYQRPNRRQPHGGAILPAHVKPVPRVTVIADTSGSMEESRPDVSAGRNC